MKNKQAFKLYGIFGYPLNHTLSPVMQESAFEKYGIKANYIALELSPSNFQKLGRNFSKLQLSGFNVTVPFKEKVIPFLDEISREAKAVGAVNTVYEKKGKWIGTNTDVYGFLASLKNELKFNPKNKKCLILGAGGASKAVLYGLSEMGASQIVVANRHPKRAEQIIRKYQSIFPKVFYKALKLKSSKMKEEVTGADIVINATSLGLKKNDPCILSSDSIPYVSGGKKKIFLDLIYNPKETRFLKSAKTKGYKISNGFSMLIYQGGKAFECWTNKKAPIELMKKTALNSLKESY